MTNDELHDLTAAYVLDALAADERREFETHLSECERCRTELAALSETVGALAYAAEGPAPPEELRDRILVAAREELPNVVAFRPRRTRLYAGAALAAAACAALAIGLWAGLSGGSGTRRVALDGANGSLVVKSSSGRAKLSVSDLAAAPTGKAYEIWVVDNGAALPAGLFVGGPGKAVVPLTRPVPPGALVAVTLERAAGAVTPTRPILFTARLPT
jgi:anti-sigma-K factor RskA